jgi:hypothetical protein
MENTYQVSVDGKHWNTIHATTPGKAKSAFMRSYDMDIKYTWLKCRKVNSAPVNTDMEYIRKYYNVPAEQGGRIEYDGRPGIIVGAQGPYLQIRLDGEQRVGSYHPTYKINYITK